MGGKSKKQLLSVCCGLTSFKSVHSHCTWLPPFAMIGLRESLLDTCRCSWPPPASPFSLLITVAMIKDMVHESSPNLGHLEGWGALLALHLRGAPSSWARPPASPCPAQRPPNHPLTQLILLAPLSKSQRPALLSLRGTCALGLV